MTCPASIRKWLISALLLSTLSLHAQQPEDSYYAFDKDWNNTSLEKASYFMRIRKESDSDWRCDSYRIWGPLLKTEHYKDSLLRISQGRFIFYNEQGRQDSICYFVNNLAEGTWYFINDTGRVYLKKIFSKGHLLKIIDAIREDSIRQANEPAQGKMEDDYDATESTFKGGLRGWSNYLSDNLRYPDRAQGGNKQGTVKIQFIVDETGRVLDPVIWQSVEFSLDEESLRLIRDSPRWTPAVKNGKAVKSYKIQPILYRLED